MDRKTDTIKRLFFEDPHLKVGIREAGRLLDMNHSTAAKYLDMLVSEGLLKKSRERNYVLYSAVTESRGFKDAKISYNIQKIRESGLVEYLEREYAYPQAIMLFGSYSKGENIRESDIDIFLVSESRKTPDLGRFEKKLGTEIQVLVKNKRDFKAMRTKNKELLNNIINGIRLSGFLEVF